jgi:hypothetical protein
MQHKRHGLLAVLLLAVALAACDESAQTPFGPQATEAGHLAPDPSTAHATAPTERFRVYTQNVYLGGDTGPLFSLDFNDIPAVIGAANVFWAEVQASDIPARVEEIVDEIAVRSPHVVSLQEMLRFVLLDGSFQPVGGIDLLTEVEAEIAARGLPYVTEVIQPATSSTLPLSIGAEGVSLYLNFTDREVSLRRTDVELVEEASGVYDEIFRAGPVEVVRAWTRTSVRHAGQSYHVVNTHLETQQLPHVQAKQAEELRDEVIAGLDGVTIISGDLNSNAAASSGDPTWTTTYGSLIDAGFVDAWASSPPPYRGDGLTCCHPGSLSGTQPFSQRIDFVLVRPSALEPDLFEEMLGLFRADIVGEESGDLTVGGRWPSDHAGLVADFRVPRK